MTDLPFRNVTTPVLPAQDHDTCSSCGGWRTDVVECVVCRRDLCEDCLEKHGTDGPDLVGCMTACEGDAGVSLGILLNALVNTPENAMPTKIRQAFQKVCTYVASDYWGKRTNGTVAK